MRSHWHLRANAVVLGWLLAALGVALAHRALADYRVLATHLLLLGAVSSAILVWSAHFAEAVRRRPLRGGRHHQAVRLALHGLGAGLVVTGLASGWAPPLWTGAALVAGVGAWHAAVLWDQGRHALAARLGWTVSYFVSATLALPVGIALGVALARPDIGVLRDRLYVAHVLVMMLGWVGLTVVGTLVTLWPTMLRVRVAPGAEMAARRGLVVLVSAVGLVAVGAGTGLRALAAAGGATYLLGLALTSWPMVREARQRPPSSFATWSVAAAGVWLSGSVAACAALLTSASSWADVAVQMSEVLGPFVVGFAVQVLLGSLTYLVPMVLGGGPSVVRASGEVADRAGLARVVLLNGALLVPLLPAAGPVRLGATVLVLGVVAGTLSLLVRAAMVSRGHGAGTSPAALASPAPGPGASGPGGPVMAHRSWRGQLVVASAVLALAVALGVVVDRGALGSGASSAQTVPTGVVVEIEVRALDMRFEPSSVQVDAGDSLVLVVTNDDTTGHDLVLDSGVSSGRLAPGAATRVDLGVVGRDVSGWCSVAGHRQMGMVFAIEVLGAAARTSAGRAAELSSSAHGVDTSSASAADDLDLGAAPGSGFAARDAELAPANEETVHRVRLHVTEVEREVAPGVRQALWTFGGTAPGPVLRGTVGDVFEVTLVNDGSLGHSIDFHAGALAPDEPMRTIEPGEELTYRFTATRSGIWMYHCSTRPMSLHIANGMFGAVIIDPPDLPEVDREYVLVQSELYLGPQGGIAAEATLAAATPDLVVFNGYADQYDEAPLTARAGERVRVWVLDAGPNRPSSFHVVGAQLDTVFLEGAFLLGGPGSDPLRTGGAQSLALQPAQGGFVELVPPEPGRYPFVTHVMVDAERGAHGTLEVTE